MKNKKFKVSAVWFAMIFALVVVIMLVWTSITAMRETPTRQVTKELPGQGWVTFRLTTNPYPPQAMETIYFELVAMNRNNVALSLGEELPYTFGEKGSETPLGDGLASKDRSRYLINAQFSNPGDYWMSFDLGNGNVIEFQIYINSAE
jgi:hypothetical protein